MGLVSWQILLAVSVLIKWNPASTTIPIDGYRIFTKDLSSTTYVLSKTVPTASTETTISLDLAVPKSIVVRAFNAFGESINSNEVSAGYPMPPSGLTASPQ